MDPQTAADSSTNGNPILGVIFLVVAIAVFAWLLLTLQRAAAAVPEPSADSNPASSGWRSFRSSTRSGGSSW